MDKTKEVYEALEKAIDILDRNRHILWTEEPGFLEFLYFSKTLLETTELTDTLSVAPPDCNYSCNDGPCTCSGTFIAVRRSVKEIQKV